MTTISEPQSCCDESSSGGCPCSSTTPNTVTVTLTDTALPGGGDFDDTYTLTYQRPCHWTGSGGVVPYIFLDLIELDSGTVRVLVGVSLSSGYVWYSADIAKPFDCNVQHDLGSSDGHQPDGWSGNGGTAQMN